MQQIREQWFNAITLSLSFTLTGSFINEWIKSLIEFSSGWQAVSWMYSIMRTRHYTSSWNPFTAVVAQGNVLYFIFVLTLFLLHCDGEDNKTLSHWDAGMCHTGVLLKNCWALETAWMWLLAGSLHLQWSSISMPTVLGTSKHNRLLSLSPAGTSRPNFFPIYFSVLLVFFIYWLCLLLLLSHSLFKCGFLLRHMSRAASLDQLYL